jgi:beta-galactosidase
MKVGDITAFHERRPEQPIVGSEEASTVCTRGEYADDASKGYVNAYDTRTPGWGSTSEKWWTFFAERPWLAGGFVWTGFDYRGEPIPYKWPCTASHFGLMDLCGFPKDNYYYYKAWWSDEPVLHLFPHWDWPGREGREIDVRCFTNCDRAELFLNGKSQGVREVERNSHAAWKVLYAPGKLEARGYREGRLALTAVRETSGQAKRLRISADRESIRADGEDIVVLSVMVADDAGRPVPTANDVVTFDVSGAGRLIGVGNGDPSSHESDKVPFRRLFNGLAMGIVQASREDGAMTIVVRSPGLVEARTVVRSERAKAKPSAP